LLTLAVDQRVTCVPDGRGGAERTVTAPEGPIRVPILLVLDSRFVLQFLQTKQKNLN